MLSLLLVVCLLGVSWASTPTPIVDDSLFDTGGLTLTPVSGNEAILTRIYEACGAHPKCNFTYGLGSGGTLSTFANFLTEAQPTSSPVYFEGPIIDLADGQELGEVLDSLWPLVLIAAADFNTCGPGEVYVPQTRTCRADLGTTPHSDAEEHIVIIVLLGIIVILLAFNLGRGWLWDTPKATRQ